MSPTELQKKAFEKVVKGSNITNAMKDVGYSVETAKRTNKLTNSKGWIELQEKYLPDKKLAKVHNEGLEAKKKIFKNNNETKRIEYVGSEPDYATRHKYLDTAYKIKDKYPRVKGEGGDKTLILIVTEASAIRYGVKPKESTITPDTGNSSPRSS